jgi:AlwI restriction endonuclease
MPGARTSRTRTWSIPTSPRSPEKIAEELRLARDNGFLERVWDKLAQRDYAALLVKTAGVYEGAGHAAQPDFAARDRIHRAPRTFGFVRIRPGRPLALTLAGQALLRGDNLPDLFLRQLLKWQYPSPNHGGADYRDLFSIRPFMEMLRLIRDADGISKAELGLFGVPLVRWRDYSSALGGIMAFRHAYAAISGYRNRKELVRDHARDRMRMVYADDIASGRTAKREGGTRGFEDTKFSNARDYADAAVRYFRATGLFTPSARYSRLSLLPERLPEVDEMLATWSRDPLEFDDPDAFFDFLGDPEQPVLPSDGVVVLRAQITALYEDAPVSAQSGFAAQMSAVATATSARDLKAWYQRLLDLSTEAAVAQRRVELSVPAACDEVVDLYDRITDRTGEVLDGPLFLEWNTWRALVMLDDGEVIGNFAVDRTGQPLHPAPGKGADITCEYRDFHLLVEVTLQTGMRQYFSEGEPVERHVGFYQAIHKSQGDDRPVYGLFVAPTLNPSAVNYFCNLHLMARPSAAFQGLVRVIPLSLSDFMTMLRAAQPYVPVRSTDMLDFLRTASDLAATTANETDWADSISALAKSWLAGRRTDTGN